MRQNIRFIFYTFYVIVTLMLPTHLSCTLHWTVNEYWALFHHHPFRWLNLIRIRFLPRFSTHQKNIDAKMCETGYEESTALRLRPINQMIRFPFTNLLVNEEAALHGNRTLIHRILRRYFPSIFLVWRMNDDDEFVIDCCVKTWALYEAGNWFGFTYRK